jgi:hypothetical protein
MSRNIADIGIFAISRVDRGCMSLWAVWPEKHDHGAEVAQQPAFPENAQVQMPPQPTPIAPSPA